MKTSELIGPALDWVVAKCVGVRLSALQEHGMFEIHYLEKNGCDIYTPSTNWSQGGLIIEGKRIKLEPVLPKFGGDTWFALIFGGGSSTGPTPLIAAMRCFVISKLGHEIEIPEELK